MNKQVVKRSKRIIFLVQGEGRGHMSQALAFEELLKEKGIEPLAVVLGVSSRRQVPNYFKEAFQCPLYTIEAPNLVLDKRNKGIRPWKSIWFNLRRVPIYLKSLSTLSEIIDRHKADCVLNFYETLGGWYHLLGYSKTRSPEFIAIAHQFAYLLPEYKFLKNLTTQRVFIQLTNRIASFGHSKRLSMILEPTIYRSKKKNYVVPPLIRQEVVSHALQTEDFILAYIVNEGFLSELMDWHRNHTNEVLHVFWDKGAKGHDLYKDSNVFFHDLDAKSFLHYLASCKAFFSTAGYEAPLEAAYLQKPMALIPVHEEQRANAIEFEQAGLALHFPDFNSIDLRKVLELNSPKSKELKEWIAHKDSYWKHLVF